MKKYLMAVMTAIAGLIYVPASADCCATPVCDPNVCHQLISGCCDPWYLMGGVTYPGVFHYARNTSTREELETSAVGWQAFLGRQLTPFVGLEAGFVWFGHARVDQPDDTGTIFQDRRRTYAVPVRATFTYKFCDDFSLIGLLGGHFYQVRLRPRGTSTSSGIHSGVDFNFGLAFEYDFASWLGARLQLDRYYIQHERSLDYRDSISFNLLTHF